MRSRAMLHALVPLALAFAALVVREATRAPVEELPAPGTPRVFAPPPGLVLAALTGVHGEYALAPLGGGRLANPSAGWRGETVAMVTLVDGTLRVAEDGVSVELSLARDDRGDTLELSCAPAPLRASLVPGVRSAQLVGRLELDGEAAELRLDLYLIATGADTARAFLLGELGNAAGSGTFALELALSARR